MRISSRFETPRLKFKVQDQTCAVHMYSQTTKMAFGLTVCRQHALEAINRVIIRSSSAKQGPVRHSWSERRLDN